MEGETTARYLEMAAGDAAMHLARDVFFVGGEEGGGDVVVCLGEVERSTRGGASGGVRVVVDGEEGGGDGWVYVSGEGEGGGRGFRLCYATPLCRGCDPSTTQCVGPG